MSSLFRPKEYAQWSNGAWAGNTDHLYRKKRGKDIKQQNRTGIFGFEQKHIYKYLSQERKEVKLYQDHLHPPTMLKARDSVVVCSLPDSQPIHRVPQVPTQSTGFHRFPLDP